MPRWFLIDRNGSGASSHRAFTTTELREYKNSASCYTFINELTNATKRVGLACTAKGRRRLGLRDGAAPSPAPAAPPPAPASPTKPVAGWWPFGKKKAPPKRKPRAGEKLVYFIPGRGHGPSAVTKRGYGVMAGTRRRQRRRR